MIFMLFFVLLYILLLIFQFDIDLRLHIDFCCDYDFLHMILYSLQSNSLLVMIHCGSTISDSKTVSSEQL